MEASSAGLATADAGEATEGHEAQPEVTLDDINGRLDSLSEMLEQQRDARQEAAPQGEPEPTEEPAAEEGLADLSFLDEASPQYEGPEAAIAQLEATIRNVATEAAERAAKPGLEKVQQLERDQAFLELADRYPQLQDEDVAEKALKTARQWVEGAGLDPALAHEPKLIELVYRASRTGEQDQEAARAAGSAATLEGAGGASPGGAAEGDQPTTASIAAAWKGDKLPIFR